MTKARPAAASSVPRCANCEAALGKRGKCPALCQPIDDAPEYKGPEIIGGTHLGRMAQPVRFPGDGWIG